MINVENEVNKHKAIKDRGELSRVISGYKELAVQHAGDIVLAGQYDMVAHKLQEICDRLPGPKINKAAGRGSNTPVKTANISKEEKNKISKAWSERAKKK